MKRPNVFGSEFEYEGDDPPGYRCGVARVGSGAGGAALAVKLYEVPAAQSICPYHYEYEEEWLLVTEGAVTLRSPDGEAPLAAGDLVCFAPGPAGAHKVTNRGSEPARVLMFSSAREPAVAVYPDSDKIGVFPPNSADRAMFRRADGNAGYYEGEPLG